MTKKTWSVFLRSTDGHGVRGIYSFNIMLPDTLGHKLKVSVKDFAVSRPFPLVQPAPVPFPVGAIVPRQADNLFTICSNLNLSNSFDSMYGFGNGTALATVHFTQPFFSCQSPILMDVGNVNGTYNFWIQDVDGSIYTNNTYIDSWVLHLVLVAE